MTYFKVFALFFVPALFLTIFFSEKVVDAIIGKGDLYDWSFSFFTGSYVDNFWGLVGKEEPDEEKIVIYFPFIGDHYCTSRCDLVK